MRSWVEVGGFQLQAPEVSRFQKARLRQLQEKLRLRLTYRLHCSSVLGVTIYRILHVKLVRPKKELRWRLQVSSTMSEAGRPENLSTASSTALLSIKGQRPIYCLDSLAETMRDRHFAKQKLSKARPRLIFGVFPEKYPLN